MPESFDTTTVTIASPDSNIEVELGGGDRLALGFRPGSYPRYDEATLEHQLAQLGRLAWPAYLREYRRGVERAGRLINDWDPKRRRYRHALREIMATGASSGGNVQVTSTGFEHWRFEIRPGTLAALTEDRFVTEVESAVASLIADYESKVVLLKDDYFGFDLPPAVREAIIQR